MDNRAVIISIVTMSLITCFVRVLPFLVFSRGKTPEFIIRLGKILPFAIMGMLVVYCLKDMNFSSAGSFAPGAIASAVVVISYVIKKNTLLSIILGTVCYMLLVQLVFV